MIKKSVFFFVLFFIVITAVSVSAQVLDAPMWDESTELNPNDLKTYRDMIWETWKEDMEANETLLRETEENTLEFGDFQIMFNEDMIDFEKPVHFILPEGELDVMIHPEYEWLDFTTKDRCDLNYQFEGAVSYQWLTEQL